MMAIGRERQSAGWARDISRTYRGDFSAAFEGRSLTNTKPWTRTSLRFMKRQEGATEGYQAQALLAGIRKGERPAVGNGPSGGAESPCAYPKSWYEYRWDKLPANVTPRNFASSARQPSRVQLSVAVYRWHAENPTKQNVTVSVLFPDQHADGRDIHRAILAGGRTLESQIILVSAPGAGERSRR
jgi:non-lysosomal glucosylceramidase